MDEKTDVSNKILMHPDLRKFWGIEEYNDEHQNILKERERKRFPFNFQAPQIDYRKTLVELIKKIAVYKKLDNSTVHLAVYLLDVFMDNYNIVSELLHLVAFVCLLLASKFEERDVNHLRFAEINKLVNGKYTVQSYNNLEFCILKLANWNLLIPTVIQFIDIYSEFLVSSDDLEYSDTMCLSDLWFDAKNIMQGYLNHILEDIKLMQSTPSLVAAATIAATRIGLGLLIVWPVRLKCITGYQLFDIKVYISALQKKKISIQNSERTI